MTAFVTNCIGCCCCLLAGLLLGTLARLDRVLRSAVRLVGGLSKFSSITAYMHDVLHWLPISHRIQYHVTAMVSRCVLRSAPLLPLRPLLPSVGCGSALGAAFCSEE